MSLLKEKFVETIRPLSPDYIAGIDARGFLFCTMVAEHLELGALMIRKPNKLPGELIEKSYELEYGFAEVEVHRFDIKEGWNVLIHDDLLATGGTACAASALIQTLEANIAGFAFIVNLGDLSGEQRIKQYSDNIISLISY